MRRVALGAVLGLVAAVLPAAAQHPNHAQGFRPEHAYQLGGIENVNLFTGNLALAIPLGQRYPVSPDLAYGFTLSYTGNVWEWEEEVDPDQNEPYLQARPRSLSNAGLGWDLGFGRLLLDASPANPSNNSGYQSPDQAVHELHDRRLHPNGEVFASGNRFTQDGTYLRYRTVADELDRPDGTTTSFGPYGPTEIEDPFGNRVEIGYSAFDAQGDPLQWTVTDSHNRTHVVLFTRLSGRVVVSQLRLARFGGGTPAVYQFSYGTRHLPRACNFPQLCPGGDGTCGDTSNATVPVLTEVKLPDNSTYRMPLADYRADGSSDCNVRMLNGNLERLELPTAGAFEWDWTTVTFPQESANVDGGVLKGNQPGNPFTKSGGVSSRRWITRTGSELGHWDYTRAFTSCPGDTELCELAVTVVNAPPGDWTKHYFSVYPGRPVGSGLSDPSGGWTKHEYGLPFTRRVADGSSPGRYLSTEVYDKTGVKLRSSYVRYERSGATKANPRVASTRTVYHDDANRRADVDRSDFDGLGHYRTEVAAGNFPGENVRTTYTRFNDGRSIANLPDPGDPWVLGTWDVQQVTHANEVMTREAVFDADTGFLERIRTRKGAGRGSDDVIVERTPASGFVQLETLYGGDGSSLPDADLESISLTSEPKRYEQKHTYQHGSLASSVWHQPNGTPLSFETVDRTIDQSTGLPSSSRDTAGLQATYDYDLLGRLTEIDLPAGHGADATYEYYLPSGSLEARTIVKWKSGSTVLAEEQYRFDDFGRLEREYRRMPDGTLSVRRTRWSSRGWIDQRSEWHPAGTVAQNTLFRQYDPFGRVGSLTLPDGRQIDLAYDGVRRRIVSVPVATSLDGSGNPTTSTSSTSEVYDRFGRLLRVTEPNGTRTSYGYDVQDALVEVRQNDLGTPVQTRSFDYDHRGLLRSESHPEMGTSILYSDYDALGNPRRIQRGGWDLTYSYDEASRLTEIRETGTSRVWKSWTYATANGQAGQWSRGKLQSASRLNRIPYPPAPQVIIEPVVTESYRYDGVGGRVSKVTTDVLVGGSPRFEYDLAYDPLGNVTSRTYPQCTYSFCVQANVLRTLGQTFTQGLLTAVPGYASSIEYHGNGLWSEIDHTNGVTDIQQNDPNDMMRPYALSTSGANVNYFSGAYGYDGAGNVTKMGTERFVYDTLSRIVDADLVLDQAGSPTAGQSYTYDRFGNLLSITTEHQGQAPQTRTIGTLSATNRMSAAIYDTAGNVTSWAGWSYEHDPFDMIFQTNGFSFVYGPGDERLWTIDWSAGTDPSNWVETWTLRDLDGSPLRQFRSVGGNDSGNWSLHRDFVWRGGGLLAAITPQGTRHFHLDHLGSPRLVTNTGGFTTARHEYFPYGEEATNPAQDDLQLKFTGHERDDLDSTGTTGDLDYMHARYFSAHTGRFLSVDPVGGSSRSPQSWNRYAYVLGNPIKYVDPYGLFPCPGMPELECQDAINVVGELPDMGGFNSFVRFGSFLQSLQLFDGGPRTGFGLFDVHTAQHFYRTGFEQSAGDGNNASAFFYFAVDELFVPESQAELGVELGMAVVPGGRAGQALTKSFKYALTKLGVNGKSASKALHAAKRAAGRGGADNVLFDTKTGDIIEPETGEIIGNLTDVY